MLTLVLVLGGQVVRASEGLVALQTAAPACPDDSGDIYVDCGNGTVTDNRTGLVWLKQANCLAKCSGGGGQPCAADSDCPVGHTCDATFVDWPTAMEFVAGLSDKPATSAAADHDCGLSDGSSPGEWRLPSIEEWEAMVADALGVDGDPNCVSTPPTITNDSGLGCWVSGPSSFTGVVASGYWSASNWSNAPHGVWYMALNGGYVSGNIKINLMYVWPVRGGQ
jgi:hypothetical protein